jgi:hypothetical protein
VASACLGAATGGAANPADTVNAATCGRYSSSSSSSSKDLAKIFDVDEVRGLFQWGLVPSWAKVFLECAAQEQISLL